MKKLACLLLAGCTPAPQEAQETTVPTVSLFMEVLSVRF